LSESAAGTQLLGSAEQQGAVFGVVIPADCRTARHGRHALSLRVFIKQPRAGSLERDVVEQLGGGHHIAAALFPPQGTDALILPCVRVGVQQCAKYCRYLPNRRARTYEELRLMGRHLCEALAYLHGAGYVHRDVKRANVRFTGTEAFLIDFDVAAHWRPSDPPLYAVAGTPQWRAPEVEVKRGYGAPADMYGLGLVLLDEALALSGSEIRGTDNGVLPCLYYNPQCT
jgi:hypothetical protein